MRTVRQRAALGVQAVAGRLRLRGNFLLISLAVLSAFLVQGCGAPRQRTSGTSTPAARATAPARSGGSSPVANPISRASVVKVYASSGTPSDANNDVFDTAWRSDQGTIDPGHPAWVAYDLSQIPIAQRQKVLVVWYVENPAYDYTVFYGANSHATYDLPSSYTIDISAAPGAAQQINAAPADNDSGWKRVATVSSEHFQSRQFLVNLSGANWIRMRVTQVDGSPENEDASMKMDVYDVGGAHGLDGAGNVRDDFIFYGDSITAEGMSHGIVAGVKSFAYLVSDLTNGARFPAQEDGGSPGLTASSAVGLVTRTWLPLFPGRYVGLSFGTNDANECLDPQAFYDSYRTMIEAVLAAHKVPMIPTIPHSATDSVNSCGPAINAKIRQLYHDFPLVIPGPDLWSVLNTAALIPDLHPSDQGYGALRQAWATTVNQAIYQGGR